MDQHPPDTVILRAPKSRGSIPLLRLVIGGVAARGRMGVEELDDLQLAVETLVVEEQCYTGELELQLSARADRLMVRLDGLCNRRVEDLLSRTGSYSGPGERLINVRMLLNSLVDSYEIVPTGSDRFAVEMEKWTP